MKTEEKAYELHQKGLSFGAIASQLGIGKTTAYGYVKEQKLLNEIRGSYSVPNGSEQASSKRSERLANTGNEENSSTPTPPNTKQKDTEVKRKIAKEFTGDELVKMKFKYLEFEGKFLELIGKPEKIFSAIIWGLPKGGKSNFSIRFADYLEEYFGRVLYIAAEEGESVTLQQKLKDIGGSKMKILETRDSQEIRKYLSERNFDFIFIDSINVANIDSELLELLKNENPTKSFIAITQATKSGNFKGDQSLTHNCDFIIKVVDCVAYHEGRFGPASEVKIFDEPLYQKNTNKVEEFMFEFPGFRKMNATPKVILKPLEEIFPSKTKSSKTTDLGTTIKKPQSSVNAKGLIVGTGIILAGALIYELLNDNS